MDVDPPSTSANAGKDGAAAPELKGWQKRGLRALNHPHIKPLDHLEVLPTIKDGMVTDWDLWDTVVHEALMCDSACLLLCWLILLLCLASCQPWG